MENKIQLASQIMSSKVGHQITPNMVLVEGYTPGGSVYSARFMDIDGTIKTVICSMPEDGKPSVHLAADSN